MKRGALKKSDARLMTLWVPDALVPLIDQGVRIEDSDRSKFVRQAVREKLNRLGLMVKEAA